MDRFICVHTCPREEALVIAGLLRASEIAVHLIEDSPGNLRPFSDKKPVVRIMVPREAAEFAYQLIRDSQEQDFADFEQSAEQDDQES